MWFWKKDVNNVEKKWVSTFTVCGFETTCWALCGVKTTNVESKLLLQLLLCGFDICLFLFDRTAKLIRQKFQLAGVVLMVSNPHVFNLTRQLESKPPEFPTLAATDLTYPTCPYDV
jgi:hypothetical protein